MATVKYDTKTGKKLKSGQTTVVNGKTVKAGSSYEAAVSGSSSSSSSSKSSGSSSSGSSSLSTPINIDSNPGQALQPGQVYTYQGQTYTQPGGSSSTPASTTTPSSGSSSSGSSGAKTAQFGQYTYNVDANGVPYGSPITGSTSSTPISSANLKIGSTGAEVVALQKLLGITADGVFGPQTDAAVKAYQQQNGLTADGIVGTNTAAKMNSSLPAAPAPTAIDTNVPNPLLAPALPPAVEDPYASYYASLAQQQAQMQLQIDNARNEQIQRIQQDKQYAEQELADLRNQQADIINEQGATALAEKQAKLDALALETQRFDEAYKLKQGFVTQLTDLITQGNAIIASQKATTGLTAIRNPRVNETLANLTAAAAVIKIGIDAQDNNMTQVQNQLNVSVDAITSAYQEQLNYYKTLNDFYESMSADTNQKLVTLTANEQDFINTTISTLQKKIDTVEENANAIRDLFIDPDTATAFARAGITLTTPQSEWGAKLAKQSYADELVEQSNDMAGKGYTALVGGNVPVGAEVVRVTDSSGKVKTYWKKGSGSGAGSSGTNFIDVMQAAVNEGATPEEAARAAAVVSENAGIPVDQKTINAWTAEARNLKPNMSQETTPETTTTVAPGSDQYNKLGGVGLSGAFTDTVINGISSFFSGKGI